MKRSLTGACLTLMSLFGLAVMCGGAAPPATQPDMSPLEMENRALRSKLMELNNRNLNLEIEIAKLKLQIKALQDQLAQTRRPTNPQPFRFEVPAPVKPYPTPANPVPKNWVPKKYGDTEFYLIPLNESAE